MKEAAESAAFDASSMRKGWQPIWGPEGKEGRDYDPKVGLEGWSKYARGTEFPQSPLEIDALPSRERFLKSVVGASGAAGFDGWTANELKALLKHCAFLLDELYTLWIDTAKTAAHQPNDITTDLMETLFS